MDKTYTYPAGTVTIHSDCVVQDPTEILKNVERIVSEWVVKNVNECSGCM